MPKKSSDGSGQAARIPENGRQEVGHPCLQASRPTLDDKRGMTVEGEGGKRVGEGKKEEGGERGGGRGTVVRRRVRILDLKEQGLG